jgi:hypothetical protein
VPRWHCSWRLSLPADARRDGGHGWHRGGGPRFTFQSGHRFGGAYFAPRIFHRRHVHRRIFIGAPVYYGYYYDDGCYWLRRRAIYTGSAYWWSRYRACLAGYY